MSWLIAQIKYRSKAVIAGIGALLATAAVAFLTDPGTEKAILSVIPAQYLPLATLLVGAILTGILHQVRLGAKPATATDTAPVTELADSPATTMISTIDPTQGH